MCLTATGGSDGSTVPITGCNGSSGELLHLTYDDFTVDRAHYNEAQQWQYFDGQLHTGANMCLDVTNGSTADGNFLQVWSCVTGSANQQFVITGDNRIAWTNMGKCVDLTNGSTANGNRVRDLYSLEIVPSSLRSIPPIDSDVGLYCWR
jgi:hypothetical protein